MARKIGVYFALSMIQILGRGGCYWSVYFSFNIYTRSWSRLTVHQGNPSYDRSIYSPETSFNPPKDSYGVCLFFLFVLFIPAKYIPNLLTLNIRTPQTFFSKPGAGSILNRFSQDMTLIESPLSIAVLFTIFSEFPVLLDAYYRCIC